MALRRKWGEGMFTGTLSPVRPWIKIHPHAPLFSFNKENAGLPQIASPVSQSCFLNSSACYWKPAPHFLGSSVGLQVYTEPQALLYALSFPSLFLTAAWLNFNCPLCDAFPSVLAGHRTHFLEPLHGTLGRAWMTLLTPPCSGHWLISRWSRCHRPRCLPSLPRGWL